jgi:hypothetical protein
VLLIYSLWWLCMAARGVHAKQRTCESTANCVGIMKAKRLQLLMSKLLLFSSLLLLLLLQLLS